MYYPNKFGYSSSGGAATARDVSFVSSGNLSSTNVQDALDEVDDEAVFRPVASTINAVARYGDVSGGKLKDSSVLVDDNANITASGLIMAKQPTPAPAEAGTIKIYAKDNGNIYQIDEFGVEKTLGGGGGSATNYKFSTSITPPPASGFCQFNSITPANVTAIHLNKTNSEGVDISPILATLRQGDQLLFSNAAKTNLKLYTISQETDNLTYVTLTVTLENQSNVANYTNNEEISVGFLIQNPFNQSLNTTDAVTFNQLSVTGNVQTDIDMANNYVKNTNGVSVNLQAAETPADAGELKVYASNVDNTLRVIDELGTEQFCSSNQRLYTTDAPTFSGLNISAGGTGIDMNSNELIDANGLALNKLGAVTNAPPNELKIYADNADDHIKAVNQTGGVVYLSSDQQTNTTSDVSFNNITTTAAPSQIAYTPVATGLTATTLQTAIDESYNTLTSQIAPISSQITTGVDPANPMVISGAVSIVGASAINNLEADSTVVWAACAQGIGNYLVTGLGELSGGGYLGLTGNSFNYMEGSKNNFCYISNSGGALYCVELQNYTTLVQQSVLNTRAHYGGLSMMPDLNSMWVAANINGFLKVDTSTPVLSELGQWGIPGGVSAPLNLKVYANGTRLAVGSINGVYIMNISSPNPSLISNEALVDGDVTDMVVDEANNWLIIATTNAANNIYVFDISNEASITQLYVFDNGNAPNHLSYDQPSQCLFVASGGQDTKIYAWDGVSLTLKNTLAPETSTTAAIIGHMSVGTYLFTAHGNSGAYSYSFQSGVIISDLTATTLTSDSITSNTIQVGELTSDMTIIAETTTPATNPAAGYNKLYTKADDKLYLLNSAGVETSVTPVVATPTLQQVYDVSNPTAELVTNTTNGALKLKRGSGAELDNVLEIKNGAGTTTFDVNGYGDIRQYGRYGVLVNNANDGLADSNLTCPYSAGTNIQSNAFGNTIYGHFSGELLSSGDQNTFVGYEVARQTNGNSNTYIGAQAAALYITGNENTAVGGYALSGQPNSTGSRNTCIGNLSLINNTTGTDNAALGYRAGNVIISGSFNTYLGAQSKASVDNAQYRVAIGYNATADTNNGVVIGSELPAERIIVIKPGVTDVCDLGAINRKFKDAYFNGTVLAKNMSLAGGGGNLRDNTGQQVDFVYTDVRSDVSTNCTFSGINTGNRGVQTGSNNTGYGETILTLLSTGNWNTVLGSNSGTKITTGSLNTIVGFANATANLATGSGNVMIGSQLSVDSPSATGRISIGTDFSNTDNNHCVIKTNCIRPFETNVCDLGSSSVKYKNAYLQGTANVNTVSTTSIDITNATNKTTLTYTAADANRNLDLAKIESKDIGGGGGSAQDFPPPFAGSNTNGDWIATSSTVLSALYEPWRAFDGSFTDRTGASIWISDFRYDTLGNYIGTEPQGGEWISLEAPVSYNVNSYRIFPSSSSRLTPDSWKIYVSDDNVNFTLIHTVTNETFGMTPSPTELWGAPTKTFIPTDTVTSGKYFRMVMTHVGSNFTGTGNRTTAHIPEWNLNGIPSGQCLQCIHLNDRTVIEGQLDVETLLTVGGGAEVSGTVSVAGNVSIVGDLFRRLTYWQGSWVDNTFTTTISSPNQLVEANGIFSSSTINQSTGDWLPPDRSKLTYDYTDPKTFRVTCNVCWRLASTGTAQKCHLVIGKNGVAIDASLTVSVLDDSSSPYLRNASTTAVVTLVQGDIVGPLVANTSPSIANLRVENLSMVITEL